MSKSDPYGDIKTYHMMNTVNKHGTVRTKCKMVLAGGGPRGHTWSLRREAVTCMKCIKIMKAARAAGAGQGKESKVEVTDD